MDDQAQRTRNPWKITTLVLALALAVSLGTPLVTQASAGEIRQPHMEAALSATKTAIRQLGKATANKSGHRVKAIELLENARQEIVAGIDAGARPAQ